MANSLLDAITSPLTGDYRKEKPLSVKAADTAVSLTTPIDSIVEIQEELKKDKPDYLKIGMLGGLEALSLVGPGIAPAARTMIRKGADTARQTDEAIDVASNVPKVAREPFKKTRPAYKLFVKGEDGKLYPLFVNASDEIPVNQWLEADFPDVAFKGKTQKGGEGWYVPTKGAKRSKGEVAKATGDRIVIPDEETRQKLIDAGFITEKTGRTEKAPYGMVTAVAARPGYHASVNPVAEHLGPQDIKVSKAEADKLVESGINPKAIRRRGDQYYVKRRAEDQYWAEVDMADDTSDELRAYMKERGRSDINDKVPKGGSYSYVDGQADGDTWVVGGDMKVKRVLTREEAKAAQEAAGVKDLPYRDEVEEILGRKFADGGLVGEDMYTGQQDYLLASSSGMEMNEGGVATDEQMDAVFKSSRTDIDPVSGNEVPPGSLPEEVRDDIPAMLSEGEYVVPADVLRFYGVKFFEDLRAQAKMGLAEMEANGRIGGEPIEEETGDVGISDQELMVIMAQAPQEEQQVMANQGGLMGFQAGGLNYPAYIKQPDLTQFGMTGPDFKGGLEYRTFTNDAGMTITIPFFNGEPMGMIPPGYTEGDAPTTTEQAAPQVSEDDGFDAASAQRARDRIAEQKPDKEIDFTDPQSVEGAVNTYYSSQPLLQAGASAVLGLPGLAASYGIKKYEKNNLLKGINAAIEGSDDPITKAKLEAQKELLEDKDKWKTSYEEKTEKLGLVDSIKNFLGFGEETEAKQYNKPEGLSSEEWKSASLNKWVDATNLVNSLGSDADPREWHEAIQAQSEASREATAAAQAESGWTGFFSPPEEKEEDEE